MDRVHNGKIFCRFAIYFDDPVTCLDTGDEGRFIFYGGHYGEGVILHGYNDTKSAEGPFGIGL